MKGHLLRGVYAQLPNGKWFWKLIAPPNILVAISAFSYETKAECIAAMLGLYQALLGDRTVQNEQVFWS
jgi:hypothetical protein